MSNPTIKSHQPTFKIRAHTSQVQELVQEIISTSEFPYHLIYSDTSNRTTLQECPLISLQCLTKCLVELTYLYYSASRRQVRIVTTSRDIVMRLNLGRPQLMIYFNIGHTFHPEEAASNLIRTLKHLLTAFQHNFDNNIPKDNITLQKIRIGFEGIRKSVNSISLPSELRTVQEIVKKMELKAPFFRQGSTLRKIVSSMMATNHLKLSTKGQPNGLERVKSNSVQLKQRSIESNLQCVIDQLEQAFQEINIRTAYKTVNNSGSSMAFPAKMIVCYPLIPEGKEAIWQQVINRFSIEISPDLGLICIKYLTVRSPKPDSIDDNIYKMNMFSFVGNLVSVEPYKTSPQEDEAIKKYGLLKSEKVQCGDQKQVDTVHLSFKPSQDQKQMNTESKPHQKYFFAFKTCTDIGRPEQTFQKVVMIMDFLVASYASIEDHFNKPSRESYQDFKRIRQMMEHYQKIAMRCLIKIYS